MHGTCVQGACVGGYKRVKGRSYAVDAVLVGMMLFA